LKGGVCNAVVADRGVRASHFNCHLRTAKSFPRWCNVSYLEIEGSLALADINIALGVLVSLSISIPAIVKRRSAISNQTKKIAKLENRSREGIPPSLMKAALPEYILVCSPPETTSG
jgi:hypothetical protein